MFREVLCTLCQLYSAITDCSTKETIGGAFFVEHFDENTISINLQFHDPKCRESCFHTLHILDSAI